MSMELEVALLPTYISQIHGRRKVPRFVSIPGWDIMCSRFF
jgi:hypothetical protein